jgi:hypothetical protein
MIPPSQFNAFCSRAEKLAVSPEVRNTLAALGAGAVGWEAAKYLHPDQKLEHRMMELGDMDEDLFRKRTRMRIRQGLLAAALGGAAGAAVPYAVEEGARRAGRAAKELGPRVLGAFRRGASS